MICNKCGEPLPVVGRKVINTVPYISPMGHIHDDFAILPEYGSCNCDKEECAIKLIFE